MEEKSEFRKPASVTFSDPDRFRIFVISAVPMHFDMTAEEYGKTVPEELSKHLNNFRLVDSSMTTLSGYPAYKIVFTGFVDAPANTIPDVQPVVYNPGSGFYSTIAESVQIKGALIVAVKDGVAYSVIFESFATEYLSYVDTANKIAESIIIDPSKASKKLSTAELSDHESGLGLVLPDGWQSYRVELGNATTILAYPQKSVEDSFSNTGSSIVVRIENLSRVMESSEDENESSNDNESVCDALKEEHIVWVSDDLEMLWTEQNCRIYGADAAKIREYTSFTSDYIIQISFLATDESSFQETLPLFERVISSTTLDGAINAFHTDRYDHLFGTTSYNQTVTAMNATYNVHLSTSSSNVTAFAFDEDLKMISFIVSGESGVAGSTTVALSDVLQPPYVVTIDGDQRDDYILTYYHATNETGVNISYSKGTHEITITGTTVVPEFPLPVIGIIAGTLGVITLLDRTKLFKRVC